MSLKLFSCSVYIVILTAEFISTVVQQMKVEGKKLLSQIFLIFIFEHLPSISTHGCGSSSSLFL